MEACGYPGSTTCWFNVDDSICLVLSVAIAGAHDGS